MIAFAYRGMGIVVPFILSACLWVVGIWFPKRTFYDPSYTAWCFLAASILTAIQAYALFISARRYQGFKKPESIWAHSFMFLPVIYWSVIFLGISLWSFIWR